MCKRKSAHLKSSVADPDPNPGPSEPYVLGLLDLDTLAKGTDPDPDPLSSTKKSKKTHDSYCFVTSL